jgi:hypothetical protein
LRRASRRAATSTDFELGDDESEIRGRDVIEMSSIPYSMTQAEIERTRGNIKIDGIFV